MEDRGGEHRAGVALDHARRRDGRGCRRRRWRSPAPRPRRRWRGSARDRSRSAVPSPSIEVTSSSPAPSSASRTACATASIPVALAAAMGEDLPAACRVATLRRASTEATTHCAPNRSAMSVDHFGPRDRRRVDRDLVGARQQQRARILGAAHPAADGQRHEAHFGGARAPRRAACRALRGWRRCRGSTARPRRPRHRRAPARPDRRRRPGRRS